MDFVSEDFLQMWTNQRHLFEIQNTFWIAFRLRTNKNRMCLKLVLALHMASHSLILLMELLSFKEGFIISICLSNFSFISLFDYSVALCNNNKKKNRQLFLLL